ncbi:MAG: MBL fold metallo-hydrolase [Actinomycetota bacterium]
MIKIYLIPGLIASCYLIEQKGRLFLIDTGFLGFAGRILKKIQRIGRKPQDLNLIAVTHDHCDHFGSAREVHKESNALVGCHELDYEGVKRGSKKISPPVSHSGKVLSFLASRSMPLMNLKGVTPHVTLHDGMSLEEFGLSGKVVHTPGHTKGSVSVVLEDGSAFIGDLVMGKTVVNNKPSRGAFAEDVNALYRSWVKIIEAGAKKIYPAHGNPFSAQELEELVSRTEPE